jgi:Uncharacterized conserved protein (DUF2278)
LEQLRCFSGFGSCGLALDYARETVGGSMMVNRADMSLLPRPSQDRQDQLKNAVTALLNEAVTDETDAIYAFGSHFSGQNGVQGIHTFT